MKILTTTNITINMKRKKINESFTQGGFKFRVIEGDYDYYIAKSFRYKYNKNNWRRAERLKENNEHDFIYTEYDCNGSSCARIKLVRKRNYMWVYYYCYYDL